MYIVSVGLLGKTVNIVEERLNIFVVAVVS